MTEEGHQMIGVAERLDGSRFAIDLATGEHIDADPRIVDAMRDGATKRAEQNESILRLKSENAELRELIRQLWECPVDANKCVECPHCKRHYDVCAGESHCRIYDRMHELGMDVD